MGVVTDIRRRRRVPAAGQATTGPCASAAGPGGGDRPGKGGGRGTLSLFRRVFSLDAAGLVVATALLLGPVTVSTPVMPGEALVVLGGLAALLAANAVVLRVGLAPLERLGRAMATADLLRPGAPAVAAVPAETTGLITTYDAMLDRLRAERAAGAARALHAQ
jgi:two-component system sensor histidine kinase UhpB